MLPEIDGFNVPLAIVLFFANIPLYWLLYRALFDDVDEFADAVKFWITPDIFSAFRGEYFDDWWAELKLGLLIGGCIALVIFEYVGLEGYFAGGGVG